MQNHTSPVDTTRRQSEDRRRTSAFRCATACISPPTSTGPTRTGKVPALLALSPYGKELQALSLTLPPQARPSPLWNGAIEAGDIRAVVGRGYAHVIADVRGTGGSEGELCGNYDIGGHGEGKDVYDLVEWIARQPWCDGNVGMIGISYFATVQVMGAAEMPPHLKAIFVNGGHFDLYELCYHGGIMWMMPRASREGRGGDSGVAVRNVSWQEPEGLFAGGDQAAHRGAAQRPGHRALAGPRSRVEISRAPRICGWTSCSTRSTARSGRTARQSARRTRSRFPPISRSKWGRGWTVDGTIELLRKV